MKDWLASLIAQLVGWRIRYFVWLRCHARCGKCSRPYGDEYGFPDLVLPDEVWDAISPTGDSAGLLCPSCICKQLHDKGFKEVPASFESGPCCVRDPPGGESQ